ncbi:hypothetical protein BEP19_01990 [Ammoniphilus oxalaticus]|uniref:Sporulation protein YpjB n=1 Tax=Ammoniphilus oxalaticus TaxID=66863 RepID=A0A419SN57_9BACL|nr:sporulation protein YpjB [Ammoniphilus oxalaticus]RKD25736.1 hypothetical protein BEP19_01990 [Ammoniphilus oxalaticus]
MKKKWKQWTIIIFLAIFSSFSQTVAGTVTAAESEGRNNQQNNMETLDRLSQEIVTLVEQEQLAHAKGKLEQLGELFTHIGTERRISIEALELATQTIVQGKKALADVTPDKKEAILRAKQIRILVDALSHPNQPIWKSYHSTYSQQVGEMMNQAGRSRQEGLRKSLQLNYQLYSTLKPAIALNQTPSTIQMMDSIYQFINQQAHGQDVDWEATQNSLQQLQEVTGNLFLGKEQNTLALYMNSNSPIAMISMISLILFTALSYVAWRMYRGTRFQM